jgi:hypothetical protein
MLGIKRLGMLSVNGDSSAQCSATGSSVPAVFRMPATSTCRQTLTSITPIDLAIGS